MTFGPHRIQAYEPGEGQVIAERYELGALLGSGAETSVLRARDLLSGGEIAVKVFRATALRNPAVLKAFKRDLAIIRDHPHAGVVRVCDFGEMAGGFYVAMELIHGAALSSRGADGTSWPSCAVWAVLEQLTAALAWLHSHSVIHGDVRLSNIVWNDGAVKLMDFGPQRDSRQASVHAPASSCPYASPERLLGRPLTAASDLYSAAAVVYHLLVGEPPHAAANLLDRAISQTPQVRAKMPHAPTALVEILERCLNPDPALRPSGAAEIEEECRMALAEPHSSKPDSTPVLADRLGAQPLEPTEVSALLLAICRALKDIHTAGMAHPDLTPRNIRIFAKGQIDIDRLPAPPPNATLIMTDTKYAAPEMLLTHTTAGGTVHLMSDVYVLGFVAYEALCGGDAFRRQMFADAAEPETDLFWMKWHADSSKRLQPLSEIEPSVPRELSALIQRMTEKDPSARLSSLDDVESALVQLHRRMETTGEIEMAVGPEPEEAPKKNGRNHQWKTAASVFLAAFALVCGGAAWLWISGRWTGLVTADAMGGVRQAVAWSKARILELRRPAAAPLPELPARIETASGPMVLVPAGRFVIGSNVVPNETPARTVYLPAFYIDQYEVSNGRYRAFTDSTGYSQPSAPSWDPDYFAKSSHPVLNVSWRDAQAFCVAAGKRLPTEAEWEKAARGASPSSRSWANWTVSGLANLNRGGQSAPAPVGMFPADVSPFGAFDMAGNVHEWVNDQYALYSGNPGSAEVTGTAKVVRGGSFALAPPELSPSWRASLEPSVTPGSDSPVGFRCAADPAPARAGEGPRQWVIRPRAQWQP